MKTDCVKIFEDKNICTVWDSENEKWFISVVDVISVLTESIDTNVHWRKLKQRLKAEGNQTVTNCHGLKMPAQNGKMRKTDKTMINRNTCYFKNSKKIFSKVVHIISNGERKHLIDANTKNSHIALFLRITFYRPFKQFQRG